MISEGYKSAYQQGYSDAMRDFRKEQEPKTGHWIKKDGYSDCSKCGSHIVTEWDYCPNCGAKMKAGE